MRWGKEDASDEEIWHALDVAQARDFIEAKGEGLDLMIDQGGHNTGERSADPDHGRQRICS